MFWGGKWLDPNSAEFREGYQDNAWDAEDRRRMHEEGMAFSARQKFFEEQARKAAAEAEALKKKEQEEAAETLRKVREVLNNHSDQERYAHMLELLDNPAPTNPDGSKQTAYKSAYREDHTGIDVEYVEHLRKTLGVMIRRDEQVSDDSLKQTSYNRDLFEIVIEPAVLGGARAAGTMMTLGLSEVGWAAGGASKQLEYRAPYFGIPAATRFVETTLLPTETLRAFSEGRMPTGWELLGDTTKALSIKGIVTPILKGAKAGVGAADSLLMKMELDAAGLSAAELRGRNAGALEDGIPKGPDIHISSVKGEAEALFGPGATGKVPGRMPELPDGASEATKAAFGKLEKQFKEFGEPPLGPNRMLDPKGFIMERGADGVFRYVTSDLDTFRFVGKGGVALTVEESMAFTEKLKASGLPVTHDALAAWVPKTPAEIALKAKLMAEGAAGTIDASTLPERFAAAGVVVPPSDPDAP